MTTSVTIKAHVSPDKAVLVTIHNGETLVEELVIQAGEQVERCVYDQRTISVKEFVKPV